MASEKRWKASELKQRYMKAFQVDISAFLTADEVTLRHDGPTGVQYYEGCGPGDSQFYDQLTNNSWYYDTTRWEHIKVAKNLLSERGPQSYVIDVGCGSGVFLDELKKQGWEKTFGIDFNPYACELAQKKGHQIYQEPLKKIKEKNESFDVVTAFQVIEHVPDALEFIKEVVKPGGLVVISTPNYKSFMRNLEWNLLNMPPHHVSLFTAESFESMAKILGFNLKEVAYEPLSSQHQQAYLATKMNFLPKILKLRSLGKKIASLVKIPAFLRKNLHGESLLITLETPKANSSNQSGNSTRA
jgi:2-polyprenyl-3-methyl-5-hydroxy-6-metoxy-1,4-benzoquinol methylase